MVPKVCDERRILVDESRPEPLELGLLRLSRVGLTEQHRVVIAVDSTEAAAVDAHALLCLAVEHRARAQQMRIADRRC